MRRLPVVVAVSTVLVAGACSSDPGESGDTATVTDGAAATVEPAETDPAAVTEPETTDPATTDPATTDPVTSEPATTEPAASEPATSEPPTSEPTTVEPGATEGGGGEVTELADALERSGDVLAYRVRSSQATTLALPSLGVDQRAEIDPSSPASVAEVDADGERSATFDIAALAGSTAASDLDVQLRTWQDDQRLLIDLTDYEQLVEFDPSLATSPFRPGFIVVDLAVAEASGIDDIVALVAGQPVPDPVRLAAELERNLPEARPVDGADNRFAVRTTYAAFIEASGQDLDTLVLGIASGVAPSVGVPLEEVAEVYRATYLEAPADVEVTIDETGVDTIELDVDLSSVWQRIGDLVEDAPAGAFDGGVLRVEALFDFDLDETIEVVLPEGEFEDRTDEVVELFADV